MTTKISRRRTTITVPTTSNAYFAAAGVFALFGIVLLIAEK